ncbi:MAG: VTT domain-containing protein [Acholeplasmataceae bacterium]|nr:VTT domain-containing protein [Acholeplasmataceae bacterium]
MLRRQMGNSPKRIHRYRYLGSSKREHQKHIILREESLYKPLLTIILVLVFILVIIFPISIFDNMIPEVMTFLRRLFGWMSLSAVGTLLILPVSVYDVELIRIFSDTIRYTTGYVLFAIAFAVFADTFFAFVGYRFTKQLSRLFARKVTKSDRDKSNAKLRKYGNIGMFFFACTPLPFTLAVYTAGAIRLNKQGFIIAVAAGRLVKYSAFALFLRLFDINLVEIGQNLLTNIFG